MEKNSKKYLKQMKKSVKFVYFFEFLLKLEKE